MLKRLRVFSGQSNHATPSITVKEHIKVITLSRSQARIRKFPKFMTGYIQPRIPWHTYIPTQPNPTAPVAPSRLEDAACRALMASSCFSVARASGRGRIPGEGFRYIQIVAIFQQKLGKVKQRKGLGRTVNLKPP